MVGWTATHLLRRHVAYRSEEGARSGHGGGPRRPRRVVGVERRSQLGEAEVEDLDPAVPGQEEVLRLQVAVDDPLVVGGGETARDLDRVLESSWRGKGCLSQPPP